MKNWLFKRACRESHQEVPSTLQPNSQSSSSLSNAQNCVPQSFRRLGSRMCSLFRRRHSRGAPQDVEENHERKNAGTSKSAEKISERKRRRKNEYQAQVGSRKNNSHRLAGKHKLRGTNASVAETGRAKAYARRKRSGPEQEPHFTPGPVRVILVSDGVNEKRTALLLNLQFTDSVESAIQARERLSNTLSRTQRQDEVSSIQQYSLKSLIDTERRHLREADQVHISPDAQSNGSTSHGAESQASKLRIKELKASLKHEVAEQKTRQAVLHQHFRDYYEAQEAASR